MYPRGEMAERFVPKHANHGLYAIWAALVPRSAALAAFRRADDVPFSLPRGSAREIVVNPAGLPEEVVEI